MTTAILNDRTTPTASLPIDTTAADGPAVDPTAHRLLRVEALYHLLDTALPYDVEQPDPDTVYAVAAALLDSGAPLAAVPTAQTAGRLLEEALAAARAAHASVAADHRAADDAWYDFHDDVRRRAARAVHDKQICLEGTNTALDEFGIDVLRRDYRVGLRVTVYVTVSASDEDGAYDAAEDEVRDGLDGGDMDIDTDDVGHVSAEPEDFDLDD